MGSSRYRWFPPIIRRSDKNFHPPGETTQHPTMTPHLAAFIDVPTCLRLIRWLSWALVISGIGQIIIYIVGELFPGVYSRIRSEWIRKLFIGNGNRLVFGAGGLLTLILGGIFLGLAALIEAISVDI